MNDFSAETTRLLESARLSGGGLSDARRERIKASVLTQIAAVGVASSIGIGSASLASAAGAGKGVGITATLIKAVSAVALLAATGVGVYSIAHTAEAPAPRAAEPGTQPLGQAPAPRRASATEPVTAEAATPGTAAPEAERSLDKPSTPRAASAPAAAAVTPETLAEETRLVREADQALRAGGAARALTLLDEHQRRFPRGVLAPERSAERLLARCQLGHVDAKAAEAYLAARPGSAFAARIRDACAVK